MTPRFLPFLLVALSVPWVASAQDQDESEAASVVEDEEARNLFRAGESAFAAGRYDDALDAFSRAHDLSGRPELLYNIGQCNDRLNQDTAAVAAFERFLEALPDHPNARAVRARVEVLSAGIEERERREEERRRLAQEVEASRGPGAVPWVIFGVGAVLAVGGGVLLGLALADKSAVENATLGMPWTDLEERHDRVGPLSTVGVVALGVGGATMLGGLSWAIFGGGDSESEVALSLGPRSVVAWGRF
jgi:tetratricopeptide (TPR) repeat protein